MTELPTPPTLFTAGPSRPDHPASSTAAERPRFEVTWARHQDEVRAAQRLRFAVFAQEMGARLSTPLPGHDVDLFDDYCEHLLVRASDTGEVIGTYRVLTAVQARRAGSFYIDTEFDLTRLRELRGRMLELGRGCVHPAHRHGGVVMALWGGIVAFMERNGIDTAIGCGSVPLLHQGVLRGDLAASLWRSLRATHLAPITCHVLPRLPLPLERLDDSLPVDVPPLIKGYLRLGAKLLGPPAWDPDFHAADFPVLSRLADMPPRYRRHLAAAQRGL